MIAIQKKPTIAKRMCPRCGSSNIKKIGKKIECKECHLLEDGALFVLKIPK